MTIALVEISRSSRDALRFELSEYLVEFAEMEGVSVKRSADGRPAYRWFDQYWSDVDRTPLFILVAGEIAGFCLIRAQDGGWNIAEFGVRPEYRRKGVGRQSVELLATNARRSGADHLRADVHIWNQRALRFWTACGFREVETAGGVMSMRLALDPP